MRSVNYLGGREQIINVLPVLKGKVSSKNVTRSVLGFNDAELHKSRLIFKRLPGSTKFIFFSEAGVPEPRQCVEGLALLGW